MVGQLMKGVFFYPLPPITTTGGNVLHAIKGFDKHLPAFGECYFSTVENDQPKAWKKHATVTCNLFVVQGSIRFVFYDDREGSPTYQQVNELVVSRKNYGRLVIEPGLWFGFAGTDKEGESIILNITAAPHDPQESIRLEPGSAQIPYNWMT